MQAHLTKATSSVTYLLKMQSRAPWSLLSELTDSAGNEQAGFAFPALGKSRRESKSLWSRQQCLIVRRVLSTTVFYCESQSRGKHCPTEVKYAAASPKSLKNRFGTARLFIREPALDREQSEQYSGKVFWKRFYSVLTN